MFIRLLKKLFMVLIALSMLIVSLSMWRYQGDTHGLKIEAYQSSVRYQDDLYNIAWAMSIGTNVIDTNIVKMREINLYDIPFRMINFHTYKRHPSESIIYRLVQFDERKKSIPANKTKTYRVSKGIWLSKHLNIKDAINHNLINSYYGNEYRGIDSASLGYFGKTVYQLNIYELLMLESISYAPTHLNPKKYPKRLLKRVNSSIEQLKKIFPKKYTTLQTIERLPPFL
ncbi:transglycosylase domain-containing protein [Sulfurovum sp. bin170]|uniref:transglycosylase domain-containing protein n=1 Tax=Sulfurovum sp. bin170 TaxID=2695268 RepID=UPI0013DE93BB|nr:transglycosylase domain-containing protein [Sulfurovum sp. bin170]NEW61495.1 transglycosylase domain-containing protein [Sulfurovum sp. bin170]